MLRLFIALLASSILAQAQVTTPKSLLIYYGYPSKINNLTTSQDAANAFSQYAYVVWPDNTEDAQLNPVESPKSKAILGLINRGTLVYGYVSLSMKSGGPRLSQAIVRQKLDRISTFGFKGVFFDECGYTDLVSRARLDSAVRYAHQKNMVVMGNTLYPQELFNNGYNAQFNSDRIISPLGSTDGYLFESYIILNGEYFRFQGENGAQFDDWEFWRAKSDTIRHYQKQLNFKVFSVTTPNYTSDYDQAKFFFAWYGAWLNGHEAIGWGEQNYSSDAPGNTSPNKAPFRNRPVVATPGSRFISEFARAGNFHFRFTNTGRIWVDTQAKTYGFDLCGAISSRQSGAWTAVATWSSGRVPFPCDAVSLTANHIITISEPVTTQKLTFGSNSKLVMGVSGRVILVGN